MRYDQRLSAAVRAGSRFLLGLHTLPTAAWSTGAHGARVIRDVRFSCSASASLMELGAGFMSDEG